MGDPGLIPAIVGSRAVLVASTGGHLAQLHRIAPQLQLAPDPLWVTFESEQSRSLLDGERVVYLPYIAPRDYRAVGKANRIMRRVMARENFDAVVSTGAAAALTAVPRAALRGKKAVYIESVSRFAGPSLTGRILAAVPRVNLYTQHKAWSSSKWKYRFSVLDDFSSERTHEPSPKPLRMFVTLGTIRPYRFDRLVNRIVEIAPDAEIVWQLGETPREDLPGEVHAYMSAEQFDREATEADVVVTHAGVGTALRLLDMGISPVLVPRRAALGEHVDDHQLQIATHLAERGIAVAPEADVVSHEHLVWAAGRRIMKAAR